MLSYKIRGMALVIAVLMGAPIQTLADQYGVAEIPVNEFLARYLRWAHDHPAAYHGQRTLNNNVPSIDLYSAAGVLLYSSDDAENNAAFLRALPGSIARAKTSAMRPSLPEALALFPEFGAAPAAGAQYTVLAIAYPDWPECKAQNDAIKELRARSRKIGVRVLEVRLRE